MTVNSDIIQLLEAIKAKLDNSGANLEELLSWDAENVERVAVLICDIYAKNAPLTFLGRFGDYTILSPDEQAGYQRLAALVLRNLRLLAGLPVPGEEEEP